MTTADRITAIREWLNADTTSHVTTVIDTAELAWLLRRYEDAYKRLEEIGHDNPDNGDGGCLWCGEWLHLNMHAVGCPWRIAREHLEAE